MKDRKTNAAGLGTYEAIDTNVDRITGKAATATKKGRVRFTTMIYPDLKKRLSTEALNRGITSAELIDRILNAYFAEAEK